MKRFETGIRYKTKKLSPKKKIKKEWCQVEDKSIEFFGYKHPSKRFKFKKRQRCTKCKKLLTVFLRSCDDFGCMHLWIPKHKEK